MLLVRTDAAKYKAEFKERFANFAQKAPILLSFITTDSVVTVIHENSGTQYSFEWDYSIPVKTFIHEIKQVLSDNHYPRILRKDITTIALTSDEQAQLLVEGKATIDNLPSMREEAHVESFCIDKVIALKDIFIIQSEKDFKTYRYKMNYSSIFFLKNYRTGKYKTVEEAGKFFFSKSEMLNELTSTPT
jgi:hypothetical protein